MIFATDLDKTIIWSQDYANHSSEKVICVEKLAGKNQTFMTSSAYKLFNEIKNSNEINLVPVTARSTNQYNRIEVTKDCKYAIISNGGHILINGEFYLPWEEHIQEIINNYKLEYEKALDILMDYSDLFQGEPLFLDEMFIQCKVYSNEKANQWLLRDLNKRLCNSKWSIDIQGVRLYLMPKDITKENALKYFTDNILQNQKLICAADGKLDYGFLKLGDIAIIPDNSNILKYLDNNFNYLQVPEGINGTKHLLNKVVEIFAKNNT